MSEDVAIFPTPRCLQHLVVVVLIWIVSVVCSCAEPSGFLDKELLAFLAAGQNVSSSNPFHVLG